MTMLTSTCPATGETVWSGPSASAADVDAAIARARTAFRDWRRTSLEERVAIARAYAAVLKERTAQLAELIARETGKPLWETTQEVGTMIGKVELSIMTVLALSEMGVQEIWARAATREHGAILERIGAHHVIYSEASTGRRVAHAVSGYMIDYFEFEDGFAMARTRAPKMIWDKTLREALVRTQNKVTVVGAKRPGQDFIYAVPEMVIEAGDELIVSGRVEHVDAFCRLR